MPNRGSLDPIPRAQINPYLTAMGLILSRLKWDIHPFSWISRHRIKALKNSHLDQKAVILCNGPSLNKVDWQELIDHDIFTFGLNKINLLFDKTSFRPSAIVAVNQHVLEQNADFYNQTEIPLFVDSLARRRVRFRPNIHFLHSANIWNKFARNCAISINQGCTVTYVAMQLAFYLGFRKVALVGCDHSFHSTGDTNKTVSAEENDSDHFDKQYFSNGVKWQLPDLIGSEVHYQLARSVFESYGRKIINCTDGGKLEIFKRHTLIDFLTT